MKRRLTLAVAAATAALLLLPSAAAAQLNGSHTLGDFGVQSGTQPAPGFYAALFYYRYDTDTIKNRDGNKIQPFPGTPSSIAMTAVAPIAWYVSKTRVLGANYGVMIVLPFANGALAAPAFTLERTAETGAADMLLRPLDLGWHPKRADITAGFQMYLPTGRYEPSGSDNLGKGMWAYEPFAGVTAYFDEQRTVSLATTAYWELHSKKQDSDVKVGQTFTLQGGAGKSFLGGGLILGAAYYAQWKITEDQLGQFVLPGGTPILVAFPGKHRVAAFGPDVTLPVATKSKLFALVNIRYLWEMGARLKTEGDTLVVTATFPVPSVRLK